MNADAWLFLIACVAEIGLGILVLLRDPRGEANRTLFLFLIFVALWGGSNLAIRLIPDHGLVTIIHILGGFCIFLIASLFLHFSLAFARNASPRRWGIYVLLYAPVVVLLSMYALGSPASLSKETEAYRTVHDSGNVALVVWLLIAFGLSLILLARSVLRAKGRQRQTEGFLVLLAVIIPLMTAIVVMVLQRSTFTDPLPAINISILVGSALFAFVLFGSPLMTQSSEEVASKVLQNVGDLLSVTTMEGSVTFASDSFRRVLGYTPDEPLERMHLRDFMEKADRILTLAKNAQDVEEKPLCLETAYRTKEGNSLPVLLSVARLRARHESFGFLFIARDLTERHELTRRAEESQEKYQQIVESSLDGIVIVQNGRLVFVNPSAVNIFGYRSAEEMKNAAFEERVAPGSKPFVVPADRDHLVGDDILKNYEMKGLRQDNKVIDLEINAKLVSWNGKPAILASFRDTTERKEFEREQALWFWEQEALTGIDRKLVAMVDLQRVLDAISHHARALTRADFAGVLMVETKTNQYLWRAVKGNRKPLPKNQFPLTPLHKELLSQSIISVRNIGTDPRFREDQFPVLSSEEVVSMNGFPLKVEAQLRGVLIVGFRSDHEFTRREQRLLASLAEKSSIALANAQLYESLREKEEELEKLSEAREEAQEQERRRIARELHDGLGQMLTAVKFNVEILEDAMSAGDGETKRLEEIKTLLDNVMAETREISYNLMPSVLEDFGLVPALQLFCEQFSKHRSFKVDFQAHGVTDRLDPSLEVNLYRIAQEALNNIGKHAQAASVDVQVLRSPDGIRMVIADDGKGFQPGGTLRKNNERGGMGLISMRQRVSAFRGTLDVDSTPGHGTQITVDIPLQSTERHGKD